jgi:polyribonucleotide nucleotidyltransferase
MIEQILHPPEVDMGATYTGKVVNITKFGAFVNILPGRDGLLHISKLGGGRRVDRVEDVLSLGAQVEVRVDDVDPQGKVSLSLTSALEIGEGGGGGGDGGGDDGGGSGGDRDVVSFDATWDEEARSEFGDLGTAEVPSASPSGGGRDRDRDRDRGGRDRGRRPSGGRGGSGGRR